MGINDLKRKANWVRRQVLEMTANHGSGHVGGVFSCVEILVYLYYAKILRFNVNNPDWDKRDRLLVGKGHASMGFYAIWADLGFIEKDLLNQYGDNDSSLAVQLNTKTPGVEYNSGSLGNVSGIAAGIGLAAKMDSLPIRAFCLIGDGECMEGSVWESLMFSSALDLNNVITIIDNNNLGVLDALKDKGLSNLREKIISFGCECVCIDGHSFSELSSAFDLIGKSNKPFVIIANTVKGKGVSFMENSLAWHYKSPDDEQLKLALKELE